MPFHVLYQIVQQVETTLNRNITDWFTQGKNVEALCESICRMENDELVIKLQSNIEKYFNREKYSSEHHVKKLMECYERMLSEE